MWLITTNSVLMKIINRKNTKNIKKISSYDSKMFGVISKFVISSATFLQINKPCFLKRPPSARGIQLGGQHRLDPRERESEPHSSVFPVEGLPFNGTAKDLLASRFQFAELFMFLPRRNFPRTKTNKLEL